MNNEFNNFDNEAEDLDEMFVTLTFDEGEEECLVLTIFDVNEQDYIALLPVDEEKDEVYFYRSFEDLDGNPELENIESDEEFESVTKVFDELMEEAEDEEE